MRLTDYYFAHDEMFVIPIEELAGRRINAEFAARLREHGVSQGWIDLFNCGLTTASERLAVLAARAPAHWFPPRLQHVCIVTQPRRVRPYFQPFNKSAWLLYQTDFDPAASNAEFAAYMFVHAERMALLQEVTQTAVRNLSYWLLRSADEVEQFSDACRRSRRPDAAAFRALAEAMPWIRRLHHESLKPPVDAAQAYEHVPHTGLLVPRASMAALDALVRRGAAVARDAMARFYETYARRGRDRASELIGWVQQAQPQVVITGLQGTILWEPAVPSDMSGLRAAVRGIGAAAAESIRADLHIIDTHTSRFLASVRQPDALPMPHPDTAQNGLSYLHRDRRLIAYNLFEANMERLRVPAPPFECFMLGARTVHEWAHLAVDAGWVSIAPARQTDHAKARTSLSALFDAIYRDAPAAVRRFTGDELTRFAGSTERIGAALAGIPLSRMPDFQANLLAREYLALAERETYVRNNVYCLAFDYPPGALFQRLARYAFEYQYLRLSEIADPLAYFMNSTWVPDEYLQRAVLSAARLRELFDVVGALCACYATDRTKFV